MAEDELLKNFRGSAHVENGRPEMQSRLGCLHWFGTPVYVFGSINDPIKTRTGSGNNRADAEPAESPEETAAETNPQQE